jgi:hypothetical protein
MMSKSIPQPRPCLVAVAKVEQNGGGAARVPLRGGVDNLD